MHICVRACALVGHVHRRLEDNLWESVLSFRHVDPGDQTQVARFGGNLTHWTFLQPSPIIF